MRKSDILIAICIVSLILLSSYLVYLVNIQYSYEQEALNALEEYQLSRYIRGVYDCSDMCKDLEPIFESLGIETKVIIGKEKYTSSLHSWLYLNISGHWYEFETTHLRFEKVSDYFDVMFILDDASYIK